jgi:predicted transglutaminase-like cysteine proteinase
VRTIRAAAAALAVALATMPRAAEAAPLLGTMEFRTASLAGLTEWQRVLRGIEAERPIYKACLYDPDACPTPGARAWQEMIQSQTAHAPMDQLLNVNRFLNNWQYKPDSENYGRRDYWATPLEFLRRSGDCEDYAIVKYVTLRQLGYASERLRLVVVRDTVRDIAHAVLAVYLDDEVYVMDNLNASVLPQDRVSHYVPYYSTNEASRWAHVTPLQQLASEPTRRVAPSTEAGRTPASPSSP